MTASRGLARTLLLACCAVTIPAFAAEPGTGSAEALRARFAELTDELAHSQFHEPLHLESVESSGALTGHIYARVDYAFALVDEALNGPDHWCDVLILHVNTQYCRVQARAGGDVLTMNVGPKQMKPLEHTYRLEFAYRVAAATDDYFRVELSAEKGPLATSHYLIVLEAAPLNAEQSIVYFSYSYAYGFAARFAMNTYLATIGRSKVGFTVVGTRSDGEPEYVRRVRGLLERNTMRYYLAIEAYLSAMDAPPEQQLALRLERWFDATERYPRQLHETDRAAYLETKRKQLQRQQAGAPSIPGIGEAP